MNGYDVPDNVGIHCFPEVGSCAVAITLGKQVHADEKVGLTLMVS